MKTANRDAGYKTKVLSDRPIGSYSSKEAVQFCAWCIESALAHYLYCFVTQMFVARQKIRLASITPCQSRSC